MIVLTHKPLSKLADKLKISEEMAWNICAEYHYRTEICDYMDHVTFSLKLPIRAQKRVERIAKTLKVSIESVLAIFMYEFAEETAQKAKKLKKPKAKKK